VTGPAIRGIGVDAVDIDRFRASLARFLSGEPAVRVLDELPEGILRRTLAACVAIGYWLASPPDKPVTPLADRPVLPLPHLARSARRLGARPPPADAARGAEAAGQRGAARGQQPGQAAQALMGLLEQGGVAFSCQGPVLLGIGGAREGPQARAGAAAEQEGDQRWCGHG
jgi:hypothetical protein